MPRRLPFLVLTALGALGMAACGTPDRVYYDPLASEGGPPADGGSNGDGAGGDDNGGSSGETGGTTGAGGTGTGGTGIGGAGTGGTGGGGPGGGDGGPGGQDAGPPPPPVVPGRPGMDLVASGAAMSSRSYKLVYSIGESPGGNGLMSSASYSLRSGLIATTQPE